MTCLYLRRLLICAFTILVCAQLCAATDLTSAKAALKRKDYAAAFKELSPLAKQGSPDAQVLLGRMYLLGNGVLKDPDEAYKLFRAASAQGNADAEFFVGARSVLRHEDMPTGLKCLRASAEQGNKDAQLLLGKAYLDGNEGLPRDPVKADMWLRLAAKDNLPFYELQLESGEQEMNAGQIAKGKALAAAWKPKHGLKPGDMAAN